MVDLKNYTKSDIVNLIEENIIGRHAERNRKIVYRRYIDGILLEPLAEEFDLSVTRIKDILYECEKRLFR